MCCMGDSYRARIRILEDTLFEASAMDIEECGYSTKLFKKGEELLVEVDGDTGIIYAEDGRTWVRLKAEGIYNYYEGINHTAPYVKELSALKDFYNSGFYRYDTDNEEEEIERFQSVVSKLNSWYEEIEEVPFISN